MKNEFFGKCQECEWEGALEGDSCPACGSFIFADISLYNYLDMKETIRLLTDKIQEVIIWENEDFKVVRRGGEYFVSDNGYGNDLVVSIDDYQGEDGDDTDFVYKISPYNDEEMTGDIDYQIRQLNNNNYATYSLDAWEEANKKE